MKWWRGGGRRRMGQKPRFKAILRRLVMIDEGYVEDRAGFGLGLTGTGASEDEIADVLLAIASMGGAQQLRQGVV